MTTLKSEKSYGTMRCQIRMPHNEASKFRSVDIAFVADAPILRRLAQIMGEFAPDLEWEIRCSDGTAIKYERVDDVLKFTNSKDRRISGITVRTQRDSQRSGYFVLSESGDGSIEYTIMGEQQEIFYFGQHLDEIVSAMRQWYSPVSTATSRLPLPIVIALVIGGSFVAYFAGNLISPFSGIKQVFVLVALLCAGILGLIAVFLILMHIFPVGTFAIGAGRERYRRRQFLRTGVIGTFLLGVLASAVANMLLKH